MPNRLVREGILTSDRVEMLDYQAEVFYRRLLSKVDDHGLFDARPSILRSSLYPLRIDRVREADCSRWIAACEMAGLIVLYEAGGKPYLKVLDTRWQVRAEAKYPLPTDEQLRAGENKCAQLRTDEHLDVDVVLDEDGVGVIDGGDARRRPRKARPTKAQPSVETPLPDDFGLSERVRSWAAEKGFDRLDERLEHFIGYIRAKGKRYVNWDDAFMNAIRGDWAKLNGKPRQVGPAGSLSPAGQQTQENLKRWLEKSDASH